jgi:Holliday junction resolvase RusA-like endonuclease
MPNPFIQKAKRCPWTILLDVPGSTKGKARQRFDPRTRRAYSPPSNIVSENDIRAVWREAGEPRIEGRVPLEIEVRIYVVRPKGHFKSDGATLSKQGLENPRPIKKPDTDNALKTVMDALNSRAYQDDVQVVDARVTRHWAKWPSTVIMIREVDEDMPERGV